jgi:hypothetical protein
MRYQALIFGVALGLLGCDGEEVAEPEDTAVADSDDGDDALDACDDGTPPVCVDASTLRECVEVDGGHAFVDTACDPDGCLLGVCMDETQRGTARQLEAYALDVQNHAGHPFDTDFEALTESALRILLDHADVQEGLVRATVHFQRSLRHGHHAIQFGALCGDTAGYAYQAQTFYAGVCGVPLDDGVLVMSAPADNRLGLQPGDTVVATDAWSRGPGFLEEVAASPACMTRQGASDASDRVEAAATFFGKIDEGTTLTVVGPDGQERTVDVPAREADVPSGQDFCLDPFGGYDFVEAALTVRADGVAVIRNSTLVPEWPWDTDEIYYQKVQEMLDRIAAVVAQVPDGAPIVWDIRGNSGGAAEVALGIVAGMPGAQTVEVSRGYLRIPDSDPPAWRDEPSALQSFTMTTGDDLAINHRDHPVAVLVDAKTTSAADYLAYAASEFSDALLVGPEGTAGSFGYGGAAYRVIEGPLFDLSHRVDPLRVETPDGAFLERTSVVPDLVVPYDPVDVGNGVDTVLEAAAAALLAEP